MWKAPLLENLAGSPLGQDTKESSAVLVFFLSHFFLRVLTLCQCWLCLKHPVKQALPRWVLSVYDSFLPAVGRGMERKRELCSNKEGIVWAYRTVPCGCQVNKVVVEPIRDGPFSSWYWLCSPGYGGHMDIFMRQLLKRGWGWGELSWTVTAFWLWGVTENRIER